MGQKIIGILYLIAILGTVAYKACSDALAQFAYFMKAVFKSFFQFCGARDNISTSNPKLIKFEILLAPKLVICSGG